MNKTLEVGRQYVDRAGILLGQMVKLTDSDHGQFWCAMNGDFRTYNADGTCTWAGHGVTLTEGHNVDLTGGGIFRAYPVGQHEEVELAQEGTPIFDLLRSFEISLTPFTWQWPRIDRCVCDTMVVCGPIALIWNTPADRSNP